eukprot:gene14564-20605_t
MDTGDLALVEQDGGQPASHHPDRCVHFRGHFRGVSILTCMDTGDLALVEQDGGQPASHHPDRCVHFRGHFRGVSILTCMDTGDLALVEQDGGNRHLIIQTGDMGRREATEPVRALADNCSWISHWGLYKDKSGPKWPSSHRPGKDIVVPIFLQSSLVVSYGMHTTPVHPNAEPVNRSQTFFFAGRICGDRKEPIAGEWPNCDTEVAGENGYSAGTRQKGGVGWGDAAEVKGENRCSAGTRQKVHYHFSNRTGYKVVVSTKTYARDMARSKFCLAPTGGGHGKRQVLVAMLGCIPVTMTDYVYQPFEPEIDWSEFSVPIQEKEIPQMADKLESLSDAEVASLQVGQV